MATILQQIAPSPGEHLMGLEKLGMSVFPDCMTSFQIPLKHGKYNIGLDGKENQALRKQFENYFNVEFDSPAGQEWLGDYQINISHEMMAFDPKRIEDRFTLHVLRVNDGMSIVAMNSQVRENAIVDNYKWAISDEHQELETRVNKKEIKINAYRELGNLNDANNNRLILIAKYLFPNGSGVGQSKTLAFDKLEDFINNKNTDNAQKFLTVLKLDVEYMDTVVKIKESMFKNIIRMGADGQYVLYASGTKLGRNEEEVITYCTNPANRDLVGYGDKDDLPYSLSALLKESNY
jgi:hypothetical protein